jgi:hypothetical protein
MSNPTPTPFEISIPESLLSFINDRVSTARIPPPINHDGSGNPASYGLPQETLSAIHHHWTTAYNWRAVESRINRDLKQFTVPISHEGEDLTVHFVHHRSPRPDAIPLIFVHGSAFGKGSGLPCGRAFAAGDWVFFGPQKRRLPAQEDCGVV